MNTEEAFVAQPAHQQTQQEWQQVQDLAGITYVSAGSPSSDQRPILFLHGVGGAARQFAAQLAHFGKTRHALAWDMPGYGGSVPLPLMTIDALASTLGGFIKALGLERPVLVGHSLGGMVLQRLLAEAPHSTSAVVLAQTSAAFGGRDPAWGQEFLRERLAPLDEGRSMAELASGLVDAMVGDTPDPAGLSLAKDCLAHTPDATYRDSIKAMIGFDLRDALPRIAVPALILSGSRDINAPPTGMARMAAQIDGARVVSLQGAGHLAHLEQPDPFNAAVEDFLATLPSP